MSAHTPGPWEVRKRGPAYSSHEIRTVKPFPGSIPLAWVAKLSDCDANARLIAAAPDLLEEHRRTLAQLERMAVLVGALGLPKNHALCCEIAAGIRGTREVIAKAEGKP